LNGTDRLFRTRERQPASYARNGTGQLTIFVCGGAYPCPGNRSEGRVADGAAMILDSKQRPAASKKCRLSFITWPDFWNLLVGKVLSHASHMAGIVHGTPARPWPFSNQWTGASCHSRSRPPVSRTRAAHRERTLRDCSRLGDDGKVDALKPKRWRRVESQEDGLISCFGNRNGIKKREQPAHQREETLVLRRLLPSRSSFSIRPTLSAWLKFATLLLGITPRAFNFQVACDRRLWHGQMQPGTLQSGCRWLVGDASAQKAESNGGHTPRGYPGQALPAGPGELSGMCLITDIWIHGTNRGPICLVKNAHVWTYALSGRRAQLWANFGLRSWRWLAAAKRIA